nr:hypothetical protein [Tanacetum cinerariifolium]
TQVEVSQAGGGKAAVVLNVQLVRTDSEGLGNLFTCGFTGACYRLLLRIRRLRDTEPCRDFFLRALIAFLYLLNTDDFDAAVPIEQDPIIAHPQSVSISVIGQ